ncbi:MAG: sensor histidine kinase [Gammaproteobacteria bacterium]
MKIPASGILRTTSFRVAALYALLYALLTGAIVTVVYTFAEHEIHTEVQAGLIDESTALTALLQVRGPAVLEQIVEIRSEHETPQGEAEPGNPDRRYYILATAQNKVLVGDIPDWPKDAPAKGWYSFQVKKFGAALGLVTPLPNGMKLLVAQSLAGPNALSAAIGFWVIIGALLALLAGLAGGFLVGGRVMRHINRAARTAERIQAGQLSERLPGGGPSEQRVLAGAFNAMLERIETAVIGLRDVASRTAHEMKHPLTRADQALARAEQTPNREDAAAEIASARQEIHELANRIEALLRLARLEGDSAREFFSEMDLVALAADVVDLYVPLAEEHGQTLTLSPADPISIVGDRQLLAQALANLLDNALKYAPAGRIEVRLHTVAEQVTLEVRDDGSGPGPMKAARGSGLGLPIARAIAQLHGGSLELVPEADGFSARLILRSRS